MSYLFPINECLDAHWRKSLAGFTLLDAFFHRITHRGCQNCFCSKLRRIKEVDDACKRCDREALSGTADFEYDCPWGLKERVLHVPLSFGTVHAIVGKYRRKDDDRALPLLHEICLKHQLNEEELLKAYLERPAISQSQSEKLCRSLKASLKTLDKNHHLQSFGSVTVHRMLELFNPGEDNLDGPVIMRHCNDFYRELGLTRRPLDNLFLDLCGEKFSDFIRERILILAEHWLINSKGSIEKIAHRLGYNEMYFSSFFKNFCSVTPKDFRDHGPEGTPHSPHLPF